MINQGTNELVIAGISALRGFGMGFCMMPVQTMAFNTVARDQMPRATALSNVMMRVFGSASHGDADHHCRRQPCLPRCSRRCQPLVFRPGAGVLLSSFQDAFIAMALVSASGLIFAYFIHDEVLKTHRVEQAAKEEALEAALVEGEDPRQ